MTIQVTTITGPAYWSSALVNGDYSSLDESETRACKEWCAKLNGWYVVDVERDSEGEAVESRFTWHNELYGGTARGGDVIDYVAHKAE